MGLVGIFSSLLYNKTTSNIAYMFVQPGSRNTAALKYYSTIKHINIVHPTCADVVLCCKILHKLLACTI